MVLGDPTAIAYVVAAVVFAWVAALTWRRQAHNPTVAVSLVVVMLGLGVSSVADAVAVASTNQTMAAIASLAILPGVGIATGAFVCLGFGVARPQWAPRRGFVALLLVEPVLITVAAATNPWHLWVYRGAGAAELTGSDAWGYGPGFWWHTGYSYLALVIGIGFIAWAVAVRRTPSPRSTRCCHSTPTWADRWTTAPTWSGGWRGSAAKPS